MTILESYIRQSKQDVHRLKGLLHKKSSEYLPNLNLDEVNQKELMQINHWQKASNLVLQAEAEKISSAFDRQQISFAFLKGFQMIEEVFKDDIGQRYMADIDLYIPRIDKKKVEPCLEQLGYTRSPEARWAASNYKDDYFKTLSNGMLIQIDVHYKLLYDLNFKPKLRKSSTSDRMFLSWEDQLIHLIAHLSYQHTYIQLNWLVDILEYCETFKSRISWNDFFRRTNQMGLANSVATTFYLLEKYFHNPLPKNVKMPFKVPLLLRWCINENFLLAPKKHPFRYYLVKHLVKPSLWKAFKYDFLWVLAKLQRRY